MSRIPTQLTPEAFRAYKVDPLSSTIFEPVFSVGASRHPCKMLDTWAEGAVGA